MLTIGPKKSSERAAIKMRWKDLLFLHSPYPADEVARLLPPGLEVDTFPSSDGRDEPLAWVGLVPFTMRDVRPLGLPALGAISNFCETNVRTYVRYRGRVGVYFFSLDASQALAVAVARRQFSLPYYSASMSVVRRSQRLEYSGRRKGTEFGSKVWAEVNPGSRQAESGSLEHFLLERYLFMTPDPKTGLIRVGRVSHEPYQYCDVASSEVEDSSLIRAAGLSERPFSHAMYVTELDVVGYSLTE